MPLGVGTKQFCSMTTSLRADAVLGLHESVQASSFALIHILKVFALSFPTKFWTGFLQSINMKNLSRAEYSLETTVFRFHHVLPS